MGAPNGASRSPLSRPDDSAKRDTSTASPRKNGRKQEVDDGEDDKQSPFPGELRSTRRLTRKSSGQGTPKEETEALVGGNITVKMEPGQGPKLARSSRKRIPARSPPKFSDHPDATAAARKTFETLKACTYVNKYIGTTEAALECDCRSDWDSTRQMNHACDESSDCINRATKMECPLDDCTCGSDCQNQRFTRRLYANVSVIETAKKGFGLRAGSALSQGTFIYEYIGEVIGQSQFQRRLEQYDHEGIKHFYFMSLNKDEFIDATKRGNLGRFCNHSCNPNCYVDKWVVDDRLRMGIFAERDIDEGEELTFDYNVDRYGADPQPCYCGEPNCAGVIGGKTQTNRGPALPVDTIEALGLEDAEDWDLAVAKKGRTKRKTGEDDEEYVENVQSKSLSEDAVTKVLTTLRQNKERWIAVKLLDRLQRADDEKVRNRIVRMHGYQILKAALSIWVEDRDIVLQIFDVLRSLPMLTRNKIQKSAIEDVMKTLAAGSDEDVSKQASELMETWSKLELAYRIQKRDPATKAAEERAARELWRSSRDEERARQRERSLSPPKGPANTNTPAGPRTGPKPAFHRGRGSFRGGPARHSSHTGPPAPLPPGWSSQYDSSARKDYYYHEETGAVTWDRPVAVVPKPQALPEVKRYDDLELIIRESERMMQSKQKDPASDKTPTSATPANQTSFDHSFPTNAGSGRGTPSLKASNTGKDTSSGAAKTDEDRMRSYEKLINPAILHVLGKYVKDLGGKDEAKKFAKQIGKKMVASDFKRDRINIKELDSERTHSIKKHCHEFFRSAVAKRKAHKEAKEAKNQGGTGPSKDARDGDAQTTRAEDAVAAHGASPTAEPGDADDDHSADVSSGSDHKRKHESAETPLTSISPGDNRSVNKRLRLD